MKRLPPALAVTLALGCSGTPSFPTGPSELTTGIVVYEHADFRGRSAHITSDVDDLTDFKGPCQHPESDTAADDWDDCISSVRVAPGWRASLYRGYGYRDDSIDITADVSNLQLVAHDCEHEGLNDCVSSIRVSRR